MGLTDAIPDKPLPATFTISSALEGPGVKLSFESTWGNYEKEFEEAPSLLDVLELIPNLPALPFFVQVAARSFRLPRMFSLKGRPVANSHMRLELTVMHPSKSSKSWEKTFPKPELNATDLAVLLQWLPQATKFQDSDP